MQTNIRHRKKGPQGLAILRYSVNSGDKKPVRRPPHPPGKEDIDWSLRHARRFVSRKVVDLPPANRTFVYLGTQNKQPNGRILWALNNISYTDPPSPVLHSIALGVYEDTREYVQQTWIPTPFNYAQNLTDAGLPIATKTGAQVVKVKKDEVIDWVFQNTVSLSGAGEIHPW